MKSLQIFPLLLILVAAVVWHLTFTVSKQLFFKVAQLLQTRKPITNNVSL